MSYCARKECDSVACFTTADNVRVCTPACLFLLHFDAFSQSPNAHSTQQRASTHKKMPGGTHIVPIELNYIHDGDTVTDMHGIHYRLMGIDAPELLQPGGPEATVALKAMVAETPHLGIEGNTKDKYGRVLGALWGSTSATFSTGNVNISERMVRDGWAWAYDRTSKARAPLLALESEAKAGKRGIWGMPGIVHMLPHDYRKAKREGTLPPELEAASHGHNKKHTGKSVK
jgi:micrococcal nuclease